MVTERTDLQPYYRLRTELVDALRRDVLGPSAPEEVIADPPITQYATGILFPPSQGLISPEHDADENDDYDELALPDPGVALANVRYPSSMGITFAVDTALTSRISVKLTAARYEGNEETESDDGSPEEASVEDGDESEFTETPGVESRSRRKRTGDWKRVGIEPDPILIDVTAARDHEEEVAEGLRLFVRVRPTDDARHCSVTAALVNRREAGPGLKDADSFFQPEISVVSEKEGVAPFVERLGGQHAEDEELESYRLIYRHAASFAVGHGCSAAWDVDPDAPRARRISSTFVPEYDLPLADSNPEISFTALSMRFVVEESREETISDLLRFCDEYAEWITGQQRMVAELPDDLAGAAERNLADCSGAASRMRRGVALLKEDDQVWEAFRLANHAMLIQRARTEWLKDGRPGTGPEESNAHRWRPFQIAFILLCLEGIANGESPERELADLLWFPTGGGKTEAYLGLVAVTALLRRLRNPRLGGGVTALMRYTLRLLTIQQFERASLLICALEYLRRRDKTKLGSSPITLGLWVGRGATPLSISEAKTSLNKLRTGVTLTESNPVQIHSCPWCGTGLDHENYWIPQDRSQLIVWCKKKGSCEFGDLPGLPVYLIDEDVYNHRPTLVIATVDKFASLAWRDRVADLFNLDHPEPPPELIIQDELHLISGPLGTLTGLYETVVDLLCTEAGRRPKVIASTATIRRAGRQAEGLFEREIRQFPPPALDARDSFFAVEVSKDEKGTRKYVGLMAAASSHTTLLIRSYAALLQSIQELDAPPDIKDPYWTLVGYFNSLRVLGGARMQVQDDVGDRMELLAGAHNETQRSIEKRIELTSREPSSHIPAYLKQMASGLPAEDCLDVILATNMISVGVDIDRLGLMVVMGQPPSTSEYIQGTSRVGRQLPGLVVTLFNASRSRDRSHYESFLGYHSALYRQVESSSVTPFSSRSRDRALHAVIVSLARMLFTEYRPNSGALAVVSSPEKLGRVRDVILARVREVDSDEEEGTAREIDAFVKHWHDRALNEPHLVYANPSHPELALLGDAAVPATSPDDAVPTPWSLRDVDLSSNLYLVP